MYHGPTLRSESVRTSKRDSHAFGARHNHNTVRGVLGRRTPQGELNHRAFAMASYLGWPSANHHFRPRRNDHRRYRSASRRSCLPRVCGLGCAAREHAAHYPDYTKQDRSRPGSPVITRTEQFQHRNLPRSNAINCQSGPFDPPVPPLLSLEALTIGLAGLAAAKPLRLSLALARSPSTPLPAKPERHPQPQRAQTPTP